MIRVSVYVYGSTWYFYAQHSSLPYSEVNFGIDGGKDGEILVQRVEEGQSFTVTVAIDGSPVLDDDFVLGFAVQIQDQFGNVESMTSYPSQYTLLVLLCSSWYP